MSSYSCIIQNNLTHLSTRVKNKISYACKSNVMSHRNVTSCENAMSYGNSTCHLTCLILWKLLFLWETLAFYIQNIAYFHPCTVPLNCNFIFPRVILHGTTAILQCIPITCLRRPRLLVSCNVHVSWKYTRGNTHLVEVNA